MISTKKKSLVLLFIVARFIPLIAQNQGLSNQWLMGYSNWAGLPFGNTNINFYTGNANIALNNIPMDFNNTHANISDTAGNLLFYTNGYYIADASNDTMMNGSGINPCSYTSSHSDGLLIPQACLIIPVPNTNHLFYLFHMTADGYPTNLFTYNFYVTTIDMNLNSGMGGVVFKNQLLLNDSINSGKITACRHANGRDWWVLCHRVNTDVYFKFLVTPDSIMGPYLQSIGSIRHGDVGQAKFSPDGTKFAYYYNWINNDGLDIFDFDRCNGMFFNPVHVNISPSPGFNLGCEFSSNSKLLYVFNIDSSFQYDLKSTNIGSSQKTVAVWDSFYSPTPPFATAFSQALLAPDGKIYVTTGNGTSHMHVINHPNSIGILCDFVQHGVLLPAFYYNTLPNHPNYFLGREIGSLCDTITNWFALAEHPPNKEQIKVLSNPNNGYFSLWFNVHEKQGLLQVYDVNGNLVFKDEVAQWSQYKQVDITKHSTGIYFCKMSWGESVGSVKVLKE